MGEKDCQGNRALLSIQEMGLKQLKDLLAGLSGSKCGDMSQLCLIGIARDYWRPDAEDII